MSLARKAAEPGGFSTFTRRTPKPSKRSADPVTPEVYALVMDRDRACVAHCLFGAACSGRAVWHHRLPVEKGGPSTVSNGVRLCQRHHDRVHTYRHTAYSLGLLLAPADADPSQVPVTLTDGRRVLLTGDGRYEEVA